MLVTARDLEQCGLSREEASALQGPLNGVLTRSDICEAQKWHILTRRILRPSQPHALHELVFSRAYCDTLERGDPAPSWLPTRVELETSNIAAICRQLQVPEYKDLHALSLREPERFWRCLLQERLQVPFRAPVHRYIDSSKGPGKAQYLTGARLNAAEVCFANAKKNCRFRDDDAVAIIFQSEATPGQLRRWRLKELEQLCNRVANGLEKLGLRAGDAVAIDMPMTAESVAIYLGIVKAGMAVVSIADSFSSPEIQVRIDLAKTKLVFTQDDIHRGDRRLPLYRRVLGANPKKCIVLSGAPQGPEAALAVTLRDGDMAWRDFLSDSVDYKAKAMPANAHMNILFSSGTTGTPKAIPWTHVTPLRAAADGHVHTDIKPGEVVCWPTNLGWMMGPWLIFAALANGASIALYYGAPGTRGFCEFVERARVNMVGVIPSIVKAWRRAEATRGLDWSQVTRFASTGEASNARLYRWLMAQVPGYAPVIEYCGGTEIGGSYITGCVVQPQVAAAFSTPAVGTSFDLIADEESGRVVTHDGGDGQVALCPASLGLSTVLLNRDHYKTYYEGMPRGLRRHGDQLAILPDGYYRAHGRVDDTMNLGGIKVSSVELETVCTQVNSVRECACVAVPPPDGGPSQLVVFAVLTDAAKRSGGAAASPQALKRYPFARASATRLACVSVCEWVVSEWVYVGE
ncbi:MAG: hypothetical protein MHM6MM_001861 [Cercozoa sp. M6MM]